MPLVNGGEGGDDLTRGRCATQKPRMLDFDPARPAATPRDASTVLVLRSSDTTGSVEIFCVQRHPRSGFLGGAVVFPGGKLDAADGDPAWLPSVTSPAPRSESFETPQARAHALAIAACRELLEEAAILPVVGDAIDDEAALSLRAKVRAGSSLREELARQGLVLDIGRLVPFGRWVTPEAESRRFDARFYMLPLPAGQRGHHDAHETTTSFWATPASVLERWMAGEISMAPPTTRALELLSSVRSVEEALALAGAQSLLPICPLFVADETAPFLALPGDPAHPIAERRIDGATRFVMRDGRFVSETSS